MQERRLAGAGLDFLPEAPPAAAAAAAAAPAPALHALAEHPSVIVLPRLASRTVEAQVRAGCLAVECLVAGLFLYSRSKDARPVDKPADTAVQRMAPQDDSGEWLPEWLLRLEDAGGAESPRNPFVLESAPLADLLQRRRVAREQRPGNTDSD